MPISPQPQIPRQKSQPPKHLSPAKTAPKPQPSGLSREEIRQIVLDMIG